ncbi:hypothetical protein C2U54_13245 [Leclercia sp. LSNIH1]|nr:hypothetical protein C2U54_13245 [Leclercia sp. LSNIH1]POV32927.1 hypothetical protein C3388_19320 [Leclercia sp. LSNIH5]POW63627.1 hypothetical protein C3389_19340 [Leclercia sp. LSNIH2]
MPDGAALIRPTESRLDLGFIGRVSVAPPDMYWLSPVVEPRSRVLIPPQTCNMRKKSPHFHASSSLNMAVRGGLTRCARRYSAHPWASPLRGQRKRCSKTLPAFLFGQPVRCALSLSNWLRQLSNPGRGFSSPHRRATCEKKARICMRALL